MKIGDKIRGIRSLKGLSQENMAEMLNVSLRAYGDIERGISDVPYSRLEQISEKLGVSVADVLKFGDTVSNFFDQCSTPQVVAGTNNGGQIANNYDQRELQHQNEKLQLELRLCQAEKEKAEIEARYWREKGEKL
jgi:XRE family transcriptional regulator, regulator of sulfur utilization